jgi:hypothetical protein
MCLFPEFENLSFSVNAYAIEETPGISAIACDKYTHLVKLGYNEL